MLPLVTLIYVSAVILSLSTAGFLSYLRQIAFKLMSTLTSCIHFAVPLNLNRLMLVLFLV